MLEDWGDRSGTRAQQEGRSLSKSKRIDDPSGGWKGRGLWSANGDRTPGLIEGGKGTRPLAAHFQLRPDPLAK